MGMFDNVVVLDEVLSCPHGHRVDSFQTKSFLDPTMDVYLLEGPRVFRVARSILASDEVAENWRVRGSEAIFERRHALEPVTPPDEIVFYTHCSACSPVLVRTDRAFMGDLVHEHKLWVEFRATFRPGMRQIERVSGTRADLMSELREQGLRVLRDDEPLAVAHREITAARNDPQRHGRRHR
jgi:hypothetical protein